MSKIDFKKEFKYLYKPSGKRFEVVDVPPLQFLMIDGHGDPNTAQEYQEVVEALYAVSYKLKFMSKKDLGKDYVVPPLEGLWWAENTEAFTSQRDKSQWDWTMMIMQPTWTTQEMVDVAVQEIEQKKGLSALTKLRFETYHEGLCVQVMHTGSYDDEGPILAELHDEFIPNNEFEEAGKHHEIYLSDPRKVAPEKLKTVLRQPVRKI